MSYLNFLDSKRFTALPVGLDSIPTLSSSLFPHQTDIVRWALSRGRAAIFADTGLGKTRMFLEWAKHVTAHTGKPVLILTPLAVGIQTAIEGKSLELTVTLCKENADVRPGLNVTNYERFERFDLTVLGGIVIDESSILKAYDGKFRNLIIERSSTVPFRLACTATPSPNDHTELGNHAEFLGVMSRVEMLATFFTHDGGDTSVWRLKGHARRAFWQWVSSWAVVVQKPSDLGYDDSGYDLPPVQYHEHVLTLETEAAQGALFAFEARTLTEQRSAKRQSLGGRIEQVAHLVNTTPGPWVVWCELNDESAALTKAIKGAVEVKGSDSLEHKEKSAAAFLAGEIRVLVSKVSIFGFGLNWQHCHQTVFAGISNSYEQFYQAVRRFHRFGQLEQVQVHMVYSNLEMGIRRNLERKAQDAALMAREMGGYTRSLTASNVRKLERETIVYNPTQTFYIPNWLRSEYANQ